MRKFAYEIKWGIRFTIVLLLWMYIEKALGLHDEYIAKHATYTLLFAVPAILIYVVAFLDKRKNFYQGNMSYMQGFITGLGITAVVIILSPVSQWLIHTYISPDFLENASQYAIESGEHTASEAADYFNLKSYIIQSLIGATVMGVVTSAVIAIFTRKN